MIELKEDLILKAAELLKKGQVVAMPTETVYGLAASIESQEGLRRIFLIKNRPLFDPLIVHICKFDQVHDLTPCWEKPHQVLAQKFWPGPLTFVLPKKEKVKNLITSGLSTVAVRMPNHPIALKLIQELGCPVAAPSANRFKKTSPTCADHVRDEFPKEKILILDGGSPQVGIESTVVFIENQKIGILRPGGVTKEQITGTLEAAQVDFVWEDSFLSSASPGQMKDHYMPDKPLFLWMKPWKENSLEQIVVEAKKTIKHDQPNVQPKGGLLNLSFDPIIAARNIYSQMRNLSKDEDNDFLYCIWDLKNHQDLWVAIKNRLRKSATHIFE